MVLEIERTIDFNLLLPFGQQLREEVFRLDAGAFDTIRSVPKCFLQLPVANEGLNLLQANSHFYLIDQIEKIGRQYATSLLIPFLNL